MGRYLFNLRHYLMLETQVAISTTDRKGGVLAYTLKNFAYNAVLRRYPENRRDEALSYEHICQMYDREELIAEEAGELFDIRDIFHAQACIHALRFVIQQMDMPITATTYELVGIQLYYGTPIHMTGRMELFIRQFAHEPSDCNPNPLREVAELHSGIVNAGCDSLTAEIVSYQHCLQLYTSPFIIHAENSERYKEVVADPEQLQRLFQEEQERYRMETMPYVMKDK